MSYNFLRDARSIKNSFLCKYDSLNGYSSDFHVNGNVDRWDVYNNIYLYSCWSGVLFGTSCDRDCYISRSNVFEYVEAESYYYVKIMMKITNNNSDKVVQGLTTGRIQWVTIDNSSWSTDKQIDFDITADDKWRLYLINMGPKQKWQGDINNLRIYPFIDGWLGDEFAIKFIKISSLDKWACSNTQCSYYTQYDHPCRGAGKRANCETGVTKSEYTTVSGVSDKLIVNINGYGNEEFALGNNVNVNGIEMARIIGNKLSTVGIGGYTFAEVEYSENDKLKINTGNTGSDSSIKIEYSLAAEALGFYDGESDISTYENGEDTADGFDYASSRILRAFEINRLIDGDKENFAYIHNPNQYNVEGGRRDFNEIGTSRLISELGGSDYYESLSNKGRTLIELSHPINSNGRLKAIYLYGKIDSLSKVKICRPQKNGELKVIHTLNLPLEDDDKLYTTIPVNYRLDCNILVNKGDLIGIYNADLYVGVSINGYPDATFYQIAGEVKETFNPGKAYTFGVAGFAIYARSDRYQNNVILDIDFGNRINIEEVNLYGKEESDYFEFNVASCLDLNWQVDLFGEKHNHPGMNWWTGEGFNDTHQNEYFGVACLDDCIKTADNGNAGNAINSHVGTFSYFFVNGDAEWLYSFECTGKTEYCWPRIPHNTSGFVYDPVAFTLTFPYGFKSKIHKSKMYFKEKNNFRNIALSYYLGPHDSTGNADVPFFKLIPKYNSISLDGILYDETNNERNKDYIFKNPTNQKVIYVNGEAQNWEEYEAAVWTDWTILEHNFDPVECCGFRIYTNHHYSTKIMELEVYSKVETTPSLLDNVSLSFSDYDDVWKFASFSEISSDKISAFVGGEPRYATLELESSTEFSINEIEALVGNQVKLEDCEDDILLEESKTGAVNKSMPVVLENIYDKPFDLIVDIPKETSESDNIIFWSKLGSQEEIDNPEIGPGCILHKNDDYEIRNDNCQCAINVPCYGLKNLVDDKKVYYNFNDEDWTCSGTLSSGTSIDSCNINYKKSEFTFDAVSSKYWKIGTIDVFNSAYIRDIIVYYNDDRVEVNRIYINSTIGPNSQPNEIDSNGVAMTTKPLLEDGKAFGFSFVSSEPVNKIKLIHQDSTLNTLSVYTSPDNTNNYVLIDDNVTGNLNIATNNQTYYNYFAIDLEKRHDIDIIRNYGESTNKLFISTSVYTDFSNSVTSNINDVVWNNSDKDDVRWLRIKLLCGDDTIRCIRKLGIYSDISNAYCIGGGYNCEWESLGNILSDYTPSVNVAYGATVIGTNYYFRNYYPTNAVDGIFDNYEVDSCWGFQKIDSTDPYLEIDFGAIYKINKIKLYHGYNPDDDTYMNKDYNLGISISISGSFTNVLNVNSNSEHEVVHQFDPVNARRVRLTITDYDYGRYLVYDEVTQTYEEFKGSFLREVEIYTYVDAGYVDSETWPVVCMNLKDRFNIVDHDLINKDVTDTDTDWDNNEEFFKYSDNVWDDPEKISFTTSGTRVVTYTKIDSSGNAYGSMEYLFDNNIYFEEGRYNVEWDSSYAEYKEEISLRLEGNYIIDHFSEVTGVSNWIKQTGVIDIPEAGFYSVKGKQHITPDYDWGVRNPIIYRSYGLTRWVSVKRDTSENYSYDNDSEKFEKDYLSLFKVYGDTKYYPLQYNWWWSSLISSLDNDSMNVKVGEKSLKISYPTSSGIDTISFIEGDDFGEDVYYSPKDMLTFWWRIEDVNKLDTTFGDITFGILNDAEVIYYQWRISSLNLVSGWNYIKLKFEDYDVTSPLKDLYSLYGFLDEELDFRTNNKNFESFRIRYRGKGQSFNMNIDDLKIERNKFEDNVKFDKGLCLTGQDFLEIPLSGVTLEKGAIEFYLKMYCDSYTRDVFGQMNSKTLFTITNNNNDIIALNIKSGNWFEPVSGQIRKSLNLFNIEESNLPLSAFIDRDEVVHIAIVWSNDSEFMDNDDTLRLYINNELICGSKAKWVVGDTKSISLRLGGHNTELSGNRDFWGSGIFDNLKIYNYPKTNFNINIESVEKDVTYTPNDFIEISKDNTNFYGLECSELPLEFLQISAGEKRTVYIRSNKNDNFKQSKKTANLIIEWLVSV